MIEKIPLAIFSLEMGKQLLAERFLCSVSGVDAQLVRKGMLSTEHYQKLVEACGVLSEGPDLHRRLLGPDPPGASGQGPAAEEPLRHPGRLRGLPAVDAPRRLGGVESRQQEISHDLRATSRPWRAS